MAQVKSAAAPQFALARALSSSPQPTDFSGTGVGSDFTPSKHAENLYRGQDRNQFKKAQQNAQKIGNIMQDGKDNLKSTVNDARVKTAGVMGETKERAKITLGETEAKASDLKDKAVDMKDNLMASVKTNLHTVKANLDGGREAARESLSETSESAVDKAGEITDKVKEKLGPTMEMAKQGGAVVLEKVGQGTGVVMEKVGQAAVKTGEWLKEVSQKENIYKGPPRDPGV
jgi:F0F1-type ATP synthase membrane subunit b/b'